MYLNIQSRMQGIREFLMKINHCIVIVIPLLSYLFKRFCLFMEDIIESPLDFIRLLLFFEFYSSLLLFLDFN